MPKQVYFTPEFFKFFRELSKHNNREWFQANKSRYEQFVRDPFLRLIEDFRPRLMEISPHFIADARPTGGSLLRIYRDMRFRRGQDPYQTMAAARFPHVAYKERTAPGFYLHLASKESFLGAGLWRPDPDTRALIRDAIVKNPKGWKAATTSRAFKAMCTLHGESQKRLPPGFDPKHLFARDLMRKDFISSARFSDQDVCSADFLNQLTKAFRATAPLVEFLTRAIGLPWSADDKQQPREVLQVDAVRL